MEIRWSAATTATTALRCSAATGASHVADFGKVVLVTENRCIGCKACISACPYGARFVHPEGYTDKCTFWRAPA